MIAALCVAVTFLIWQERIEQGEEITYDYKFDRDEDESKRIPCRCGAVRCFGFLN